MVKKSIDFKDVNKYLKLAGDAKANNKTIGEFIIEIHDYWLKEQKEK